MKKLAMALVLVALLAFAAALVYADNLSAKDWKDALGKYRAAVAVRDKIEMKAALRKLAEDNSTRLVKFCITEAITLNMQYAYRKIRDVLIFDVKDAEALKTLAGYATHKNRSVRYLVVEVACESEQDGLHPALAAGISDKDLAIRIMAVKGIEKKKLHKYMDKLVDLYEELTKGKKRTRGELFRETRKALVSVSGMDYDNVEDWRKFLDMYKDRPFDPEKDRGEADLSTCVKKLEPKDLPKLYGTEIKSERIVIILDISGSMGKVELTNDDPLPTDDPDAKKGGWSGGRRSGSGSLDDPDPVITKARPGGGRTPGRVVGAKYKRKRMDSLKEEILRLIDTLKPPMKFTVFGFSSKVVKWKTQLVTATAANKAGAKKWVSRLHEGGFTWTDEVLKEAFKVQSVHTIYLISDGVPERSKTERIDTKLIREMVSKLNRFLKVTIHTIGIGPDVDTDFMVNLARENNGDFRAAPQGGFTEPKKDKDKKKK
jgi:hypothetical protein